ncbi:hypothetical protein D9M73_211080 [compost metagenome]
MGERIGDHFGLQHLIQCQRAVERGQWVKCSMLTRLDGDHGEGLSSSQVTRHALPRRGSEMFEPVV